MSSQLMLAFLLFSTSIAITPGAGNIALLGISSRYGFAATLPFISGNAFGIIIVLAGSSVGLVSLFTLYPELYNILKYAGAAYLLFMAWSIANMQIEESNTDNRSGFVSGVLVQVLNPKGWIASLTVFSQFITPNADYLIQVVTIIAGMVITGVPCMLVWAYCGTMLKKLLQSPKQMMVVNRCLGGSLALVVAFMLYQPA
ncbi:MULTISPECIES: LysE family translocator [Vibrio]|uniref:LysE family translocator n=1 Tax=Vibrio TaxID=662 RepID=UPI00063592A8|nr:LysE family translocator [Vibrio crassostreae]NOI54264.1 LysE family translocator [Vibrio crassostreae]TCO03102.1 threonine/homoserine/homoserine lactone efflux protein [Vibrio crassostreae]CAK1741348.1 cysteine/O-acetylserine efflux protein [Vibrio crassostreae]CAK1742457.1 cysteine/O-acetylserine efflux protein [Vibrio crassostreae]CAK1742547.1 cysteine/O-acetylserine efflux protein [Vibrio crassostreae]